MLMEVIVIFGSKNWQMDNLGQNLE